MRNVERLELSARDSGPTTARLTDTVDLLMIDPVGARSRALLGHLNLLIDFRAALKCNGRASLEAFNRTRFDAVVCRPDLGDVDCWRFIRMIRSGRFGFGATPIVVLCDSMEREELAPMIDDDTVLLLEEDLAALAAILRATEEGASKPTVLVVEDEERTAQSVKLALQKYYRVDLAHDGRSALELWRAKRHAIVLLDLMLPEISGAEVLDAITAETPHQVVIVLTAHDAPEKHRELVMAGATDFISKPVSMLSLPELCARALREQACLRNLERARTDNTQAQEVAARVRAVNYHFSRGEAGRAHAHLSRVLFDTRTHRPSDDQWTQLLGEFEKS